MIEYKLMTEGKVLTSCLHGGSLPVAAITRSEQQPSWLEQDQNLPTGTIARLLNALSRAYGACGLMAVEGDAIVGKVRFAPDTLPGEVPQCVQQYPDRMLAFEPGLLPTFEQLEPKALRLWCVQVVDDTRFRRKGIATELVRQTSAWARQTGYDEIRLQAVLPVSPLLEWTGLLSLGTCQRLGFEITTSQVSPELLAGVHNMRAGAHGEQVKEQWRGFSHLSDEEAATLYALTLDLKN